MRMGFIAALDAACVQRRARGARPAQRLLGDNRTHEDLMPLG